MPNWLSVARVLQIKEILFPLSHRYDGWIYCALRVPGSFGYLTPMVIHFLRVSDLRRRREVNQNTPSYSVSRRKLEAAAPALTVGSQASRGRNRASLRELTQEEFRREGTTHVPPAQNVPHVAFHMLADLLLTREAIMLVATL